MYFNNKEEVINKLESLQIIGDGSQGTCYLDSKKSLVYKIFHQFLDDYEFDEKIKYTSCEFLRFNHISNNTFIWPNDVINVEDEIVGYVTKYVPVRPLYTMNPLDININILSEAIKNSQNDLYILSQNGVLTFDLMYNILYGNKIYVTDCDEFSFSKKSSGKLLEINRYNFAYEFYYFLVEGYFDEFISEYHKLNKLYKDKDDDILYFITLFKKYLSEYVGYEVTHLKEAISCLNQDNKHKRSYVRILSK